MFTITRSISCSKSVYPRTKNDSQKSKTMYDRYDGRNSSALRRGSLEGPSTQSRVPKQLFKDNDISSSKNGVFTFGKHICHMKFRKCSTCMRASKGGQIKFTSLTIIKACFPENIGTKIVPFFISFEILGNAATLF